MPEIPDCAYERCSLCDGQDKYEVCACSCHSGVSTWVPTDDELEAMRLTLEKRDAAS